MTFHQLFVTNLSRFDAYRLDVLVAFVADADTLSATVIILIIKTLNGFVADWQII